MSDPSDDDTQEENNKEYADGYGSGRSGDALRDFFVRGTEDHDSQFYKGYDAGESDRDEYGYKSKDDCGTGESDSGSSGGGLCFITTACTAARGLPDNCDILETLRLYRETYVRRRPEGDSLIQWYKAVAPQIVAAVNATPTARSEWELVYREVERAFDLIRAGDHASALAEYGRMVRRLAAKYLGLKTA